MIEPRYLRFQLLSFSILHLYYLFRAIMHTSGTCNFFPIFWYLFPQLTIKKFKSLFISLLFLQNSTMMMLMLNQSLVWPYHSFYRVSFISQCFSLTRTSSTFVSGLFFCPDFFRNRKTKVHNSAFEILHQEMVTGSSLKAVSYPATFQDFPEGHQYRLSLHHYFAAQRFTILIEGFQGAEAAVCIPTAKQNLTTHPLRARQPQIPPSPCLEERMGTESLGSAVLSSQAGLEVGADTSETCCSKLWGCCLHSSPYVMVPR